MHEDEVRRQIEANVRLAIDLLGPLGEDGEFGLNRDSIELVEGFIEGRRSAPGFDLDELGALPSVLGSFLGACLIEATGGVWELDGDLGWSVRFPNGNAAYPFAKVGKQFAEGRGDSILAFYDVAVAAISSR
ncbi:hypothetical protein OIE66_12710 [Nonomuraea sp. NBC_01738]|uniref:hypothetical protein n=1 Tax=Nonomuraea sp. NBC_01738 TaxID=2976003 RepID=UPI002E15CAAE|nr:hypothetical protein OIE66_12710 [Nonomuraea sp. NBC_01738]